MANIMTHIKPFDTTSIQSSTFYQALLTLDTKLSTPLQLYIIGGFALACHNIRDNNNTPIDCIGKEPDPETLQLIQQVGEAYQLPKNWLNWDESDDANICTFEKTVGRIQFLPYQTLEHITMFIPTEYDLFRMKLIALDTSLITLYTNRQFERYQDLRDIAALHDHNQNKFSNWIYNSMKNGDISQDTFKLLLLYLASPEKALAWIKNMTQRKSASTKLPSASVFMHATAAIQFTTGGCV